MCGREGAAGALQGSGRAVERRPICDTTHRKTWGGDGREANGGRNFQRGGRLMRILAAAIGLLALTACQREQRELRPAPTRVALFGDAARQSELQPGGPQTQALVTNPYNGNAYA